MSPTRRLLSCSRAFLTGSASATAKPSSSTQFRISRLPATNHASSFHTTTLTMAQRTVDSDLISNITHKENELTQQPEPVKGGPTAQAQRHVSDKITNPNVVSDIVKGEDDITHNGAPVAGGPGALAMSEAAQARNEVSLFYHTTYLYLPTYLNPPASLLRTQTDMPSHDTGPRQESRWKRDAHRRPRRRDHLPHHACRVGPHGPGRARQGRAYSPGTEARWRAHRLREPSRHHRGREEHHGRRGGPGRPDGYCSERADQESTIGSVGGRCCFDRVAEVPHVWWQRGNKKWTGVNVN